MLTNDSTATAFAGTAPVILAGHRLLFGVIAITYSAAVAFIVYILSVYSDLNGLWPIHELHSFHKMLKPYHRANGEVEDAYHPLATYRGKQEIECPSYRQNTCIVNYRPVERSK